MASIKNINLKVLIMDDDWYALQALNSYLAWDRRTRVTMMAQSVAEMWQILDATSLAELPDVVVLEANHVGGASSLKRTIERLRERMPKVLVVCLAQSADPALIVAAADGGARGFLLKGEVRLHIAWALVFALEHDFIITAGAQRAVDGLFNSRLLHATPLPKQKDYPELTDRIRQAIELCVVRGMPAQLAADEMGISLHTVRSYIKEGYRILEAYDEREYPRNMSPQERAFMRLTAFTDDSDGK